jgi:endoglucanase
MNTRRLSLFALCFSCLVWLCCLWRPVYGSTTLDKALTQSYQHFKTHFMQDGSRVPSQTFGGVITEGQSYAMLMAWRQGDKTTFDKTWQWTKRHMQRPTDHLLAWQWGPVKNVKTGATTMGIMDANNATDADQDIAYALAKAGRAWNRPDYVRDAKAIINDLWDINVVKLAKRYYLTAGPWDGFRSQGMLHQPAGYFAPHVYRLFAQLDPAHPWLTLLNDGYDWVEACSQLSPSGLPPNWCGITMQTEAATWSDLQGPGARDFGYDAVRIFWRLAQDRHYPQARAYAVRHQALNHFWEQHGTTPGGFYADGQPFWDMPTSYGRSALLAQWLTMSPQDNGNDAYQVLLASQYNPRGFWQREDNYFLSAIVWLAISVGQRDW